LIPLDERDKVSLIPNFFALKYHGHNMDHLDELENQSIFIMREAYKNFKNLAMLWSIGKDSTCSCGLHEKHFSVIALSRWYILILPIKFHR
tara:strand:- start:217 stop:489 length:273 start_codon:yes stop_codon:yes gene_type:complete